MLNSSNHKYALNALTGPVFLADLASVHVYTGNNWNTLLRVSYIANFSNAYNIVLNLKRLYFLFFSITVLYNVIIITNNLKSCVYSPSQLFLLTLWYMLCHTHFYKWSTPSCYLCTAVLNNYWSNKLIFLYLKTRHGKCYTLNIM